MQSSEINQKNITIKTEITANTGQKKNLEKNLNRVNKEINDTLKSRKKLENENKAVENNIKELDTQLYGTAKLVEEKKKESEALEIQQKHLMDE